MSSRTVRESELSVISYHLPLFAWTQCDKCKLEFRREFMWMRYVYPPKSYRSRNFTICLCRTCAPTKDDALRVVKELDVVKLPMPPCKPPRPPEPPPVRRGSP